MSYLSIVLLSCVSISWKSYQNALGLNAQAIGLHLRSSLT